MGGGKMKDFMPWSGDIDEQEKQTTFNSEKGFLLTPEAVAQMAESEERKSQRLAKKGDKMVQSKNNGGSQELTKEERLARLKRLNK